jgi:predicted secreted protein
MPAARGRDVYRLLPITLLLLLIAAACDDSGDDRPSSPAANGAGDDATRLTDDDDGTTVRIAAGEQLTVALTANPSVGFVWEIDQLDEAVLRQVGDVESQSDNPNLVGADVTMIFTFEAVAPGETVLSLDRYYRGALPPDAETFTVTIIVDA